MSNDAAFLPDDPAVLKVMVAFAFLFPSGD